MTWINTTPPKNADPQLHNHYDSIYTLYPPEYGIDAQARRPGASADSVVAAHSLIPDAMLHAMSTLGVLLSPELPLSRRQHEMIATVVSALNQCVY